MLFTYKKFKALNSRLAFFRKKHKMIKFNQNALLKPYTDLKEKTKNGFQNIF